MIELTSKQIGAAVAEAAKAVLAERPWIAEERWDLGFESWVLEIPMPFPPATFSPGDEATPVTLTVRVLFTARGKGMAKQQICKYVKVTAS